MLLPELAIFDMDGLMLDTEPISRLCWKETGKALGLALTDGFLETITGVNNALAGEKLRREYGFDDPEAFFALKMSKMDAYIAEHGIPVKKGLFELLDFLGESGAVSVAATSTRRARAESCLALTGVLGRLAGMICGDEVKNSKPHPEIFLACLERWNCPAERAVIFEDSKNGLLAAVNAGVGCVLVPDLQKPDAESERLACRVAGDLLEVIEFFKEEPCRTATAPTGA